MMVRFRNDQEDEVDHFQRLPNELVIHIFEKVFEAKWLFMCSLVSHRFASLVLHARTVSFKFTGWRYRKFSFSELNYQLVFTMLSRFIMKFVCLLSVHVEVVYSDEPEGGQYNIKWKAMPNQKSFIYVAAKRVITRADNEEDKKKIGDTIDASSPLLLQICDREWDCEMRYNMIRVIKEVLPDLKEAVVTDSLNQGRLFIAEPDFCMMRSMSITGKILIIGEFKKIWCQSMVKLPLSGLVMEDAVLAIFKGNDIDDVSVAENSFEEKQFFEAAMEMLKVKPYLDNSVIEE